MNAEQFAYWLQGYAELTEAAPTPEQWQSIREHLGLVFTKVTPPVQFPGIVKDGPNQFIRPQFASPQITPFRTECSVFPDIKAKAIC